MIDVPSDPSDSLLSGEALFTFDAHDRRRANFVEVCPLEIRPLAFYKFLPRIWRYYAPTTPLPHRYDSQVEWESRHTSMGTTFNNYESTNCQAK